VLKKFLLGVLAFSAIGHAQRATAIFIDSPSSQVVANDFVQLKATAFDSGGVAIPSAQFAWTVSDQTVLTVDSSGLIHGITLGWSDIFVDSAGARGTLRLQVVPLSINVRPANQTVHAGDSVRYSADVLDVNSQPLAGISLQWRAYGPNANVNNAISIDRSGVVSTYGYGTFFIEPYFNYTVGGGPFIQRVFGNTLLTVLPPNSFSQTKLLDSSAVRQQFALRERRGQLSVNDTGQIAYVGWLEGFATSALIWSSGQFTSIISSSTPAELPGSNLIDIDDLALNNNGEISTRCVVIPVRNCILFAGRDGVPHMILFDGSAEGGVTNIRNFATTRFGLNDYSTTLFRADYYEIGGTILKTGLFSVTPQGAINLAIAAATELPGMGSVYTFDRDFGIANDGTILFFATNGASRALYRMTPDNVVARVIGTGDLVQSARITSLGSVAVGKNGQYAVMANNGSQYLFLFSGDPGRSRQLPLSSFNAVYSVSSAGETAFVANMAQGYGMYRWNGETVIPAFLTGQPSPSGDTYVQFDSAGITARGELIAQARTANNLLLVVSSGAGAGAKPSVLFQTGAQISANAGPAFYNLVLNSHVGNPMIKTGWYSSDVFEAAQGALIPRLINGDSTPDGWFYEGNEDVRRNSDGDLFVSTDQSITWIGPSGSTLLAHFPQRAAGGSLYTGYQVAANSQGIVAVTGGTSFGVTHVSILNNGTATPIAWLGSSTTYQTAAPSGGTFSSSNDIGVADDNTIYASLRVNNGPDGIFSWVPGTGWTSILRIGDPFDGRNVTSISNLRVAGTACFALIGTTNGLTHLSRYQSGAWTDIVSYGDTIPAGGLVVSISAFDVNRKGAVAVKLYGSGGVQYLSYINKTDFRVAANSSYPVSTGEVLVNIFQVSINDDGRIFATAINAQDQMVLYEFDPLS
jgi:hypothetical protein